MGAPKIVLISSGQPSLNPRLVKEADALCNAGYEVTVLYAYWNDWGTAFDKQLIPAKKWKAICIGGDPQEKRITYFLSRVINKLAKNTIRFTKIRYFIDYAIGRSAYFLIRAAKKHPADLYIAHNLGALPAAVTAAKSNKTLSGFDAEDFHSNETSDDSTDKDVILKTHIEHKYIPLLNYFSVSSPQIANAYQEIFTVLKPVVLLNVFPKSSITIRQKNSDSPLKLFWFSQTIGPNRGVNDVVKALQLLNTSDFELHLLGKQLPRTGDFFTAITNSGITVKTYEPIPPDEIVSFASQFDIGLALENKIPYNRDICLTNKIFTYMQAGLAIIASDTTAQLDFMNKNQQIGSIYKKGDPEALAAILLSYYQDKNKLLSCQNHALQLAHDQYNWEIESVKFLETVKKILAANKQ